MAAAPFPLNMTAPAFGASMFAAANAYGAMGAVPGFDVGAWNISKDQLAVVHSNEMIIPSNIASGMRSMFTAAANGNMPISQGANDRGSGGDTHFHFHGPSNKAQMRQWFVENAHGVAAGMRHYVRQGGNTSPNR